MARRVETLAGTLALLLAISAAAVDDRSALLEFKSSISSDPAGTLTRWGFPPESEPCSWPGVACNSASRVVSINISAAADSGGGFHPFRRIFPDEGRRLAGTLSPAIGKLLELRILSLSFHAFVGQIPEEIWRLEHLEVLDLEGSSLAGILPSRFPRRLVVLNLASNLIQGELPPSLSNCTGLEILDLYGNQMNGTIPSFLGGLPKLRRLLLSANHLVGPIPESLGTSCRSLEHLDLSGNQLFGGIPRSFGNCSRLQSLLLFSNLLGDVVPSELGRLTKLRVLDVSRNSLSGTIPAEIGNCVELSVLVLLNLYDPMSGKDSLNEDDDNDGEFNYFQGGIAENITALPKLRVIWAPRGMLEGEIPSNWGACESLEMVNLGENLFSGQIPTAFRQCKNLRFLNLSSNKLTGWLDEQLHVPCMDVFDVSGNRLTGSIPRFIYGACPSSPLPPDDLVAAYYSFFAYRSLTETSLPYFESGGDFAIYHNLGRNNFTGTFPSLPVRTGKFGNRTVYTFIVHGNYLTGSLTDVLFEKCKGLNHLIINFSDNLIHGDIPADIGSLCKSLMVLDASGNQITGIIPQGFGLSNSLVGLYLSRNKLQGQIPAHFEGLEILKYLSLAGNNLSGKIPAGVVQLHSLKVLDLSSNFLTGEIPSDLVNMRNLTVLLLNNNKLYGKIPSGFANETSLSVLNMSFNNLSGPLPLNASKLRCDSVIGNPLLRSCRVSSLSIPPTDLQGRSGDSEINDDPSPGNSTGKGGNNKFTSIEIASITSAAAIVSVLLALVILYMYTRQCASRSSEESSGRKEVTIFVDIGVPLSYESVVRATGSFNASNCIGSGGFGATYKAEISPGAVVAIKRLSIGRFQGVQQFHAEIKTLGRWRHPNLVTLIGYHLSDAEMFLIYNYLPGGNLERFIQERSKRAFDWRMLHKIALDVARALAYLHDQCVPRILHRDVKPSNILLDNDYNAYLSDFGLARLLGNSETHATTGVAGTFGYVAPEYAMTCRVSDKADVYSYGVVLLELISDKKALDPSFSPYGNGFNIVTWASMLLEQGRPFLSLPLVRRSDERSTHMAAVAGDLHRPIPPTDPEFSDSDASSSGGEEGSDRRAALEDSILAAYLQISGHGDGHSPDLAKIRSFLSARRSSVLSCLICLERIRPSDPIWSCSLGCHDAFHLPCIHSWAHQSPAAADWNCPKCRLPYPRSSIPRSYRCYCGKLEDPPSDPWTLPHTCGEICGRDLRPSCGHRCLLLCHPGPCPPCPKLLTSCCFCGGTSSARRCARKRFSCSAPCPRLLPCGAHPCPEACHEGPCPPCGVVEAHRCACGKAEERRPCSERGFRCGGACEGVLECGRHRCERGCHAGPCGECPMNGRRTCPCGKREYKGAACDADVATCGSTCERMLSCGLHRCPERCHRGPCVETCRTVIVKTCRCGGFRKEVPCYQDLVCERKCQHVRDCGRHACKRRCCDGDCPPCPEICGRKLRCNNHKCPSPCHRGACAPCPVTVSISCACGETHFEVPCGTEKSQKPPRCPKQCQISCLCRHKDECRPHKCHYGPCPPCRIICGEIFSCGHSCKQRCHGPVPPPNPEFTLKPRKKKVKPIEHLPGSPCLPCSEVVWISCLGQHIGEERQMLCSSKKWFSCQNLCGNLLACSNHYCTKPCHVLKCQPVTLNQQERHEQGKAFMASENRSGISESCEDCFLPCQKVRQSPCSHPCPMPCHSDDCPPCKVLVKRSCHCGSMVHVFECTYYNSLTGKEQLKIRSCGGPCHRKLPNCPHLCSEICHPGQCPSSNQCTKKVNVRCACNNLKRVWLCQDILTSYRDADRDPTDVPKTQFGIGLLPCNGDCANKVKVDDSELQLRKTKVAQSPIVDAPVVSKRRKRRERVKEVEISRFQVIKWTMWRCLVFILITLIVILSAHYGYKVLFALSDWMNEMEERRLGSRFPRV